MWRPAILLRNENFWQVGNWWPGLILASLDQPDPGIQVPIKSFGADAARK